MLIRNIHAQEKRKLHCRVSFNGLPQFNIHSGIFPLLESIPRRTRDRNYLVAFGSKGDDDGYICADILCGRLLLYRSTVRDNFRDV